ncbi:MAG: NAD(P)H-hydrate dehydratase [Phycisphaerae bacterium]|nr:NAD(P)H-hydrate dehydratase [Phycisphaerae bacterium]
MTPTLVERCPRLPARDADGHKGTFGTVAVIGGSDGGDARRTMLGAPALAATAALRVGAGLATIAAPSPLLPEILSICPAATGFGLPTGRDGTLDASGAAAQIDRALERAASAVVGPGFGEGEAQQQIVVRLTNLESPPMVIDADALNALSTLHDFARDVRVPAVLTPHPGEFARLATALGLGLPPDAATDDARRVDAAAALARRLGAVVVLKGRGTVVSDGLRAWRCGRGNAALAVGGSGDVLSGVIGGLLAQFAKPPHGLSLFDCACLGVEIHARAADRWAAAHTTAGMLPTDLCGELPDALAELRTP